MRDTDACIRTLDSLPHPSGITHLTSPRTSNSSGRSRSFCTTSLPAAAGQDGVRSRGGAVAEAVAAGEANPV